MIQSCSIYRMLVRRVVPDEIDNIDEMMLQFKGREDGEYIHINYSATYHLSSFSANFYFPANRILQSWLKLSEQCKNEV